MYYLRAKLLCTLFCPPLFYKFVLILCIFYFYYVKKFEESKLFDIDCTTYSLLPHVAKCKFQHSASLIGKRTEKENVLRTYYKIQGVH